MESTFFLGACTAKGFVSCYDTLFSEVSTLNIIKGGSGCGKSTFMRRISRAVQERGLEVSHILCSSDPDSLDGLLIPELGLAYVDGTPPHVLEPSLCGGSMNYINFGIFYDRKAMAGNEEEIFCIRKQNQAQYPLVTACLAAADRVAEIFRLSASECCYTEELSAIGECISLSVLRPIGDTGKLHRRFLHALTPRGLYFCRKTPATLCPRVYVLKDNYFLAPTVLEVLQKKALACGQSVIACYSPLLPEGAPSHLLLPDAGVALISESREMPYTEPCFCRIDLDTTLPPSLRRELESYVRLLGTLTDRAICHLREAKRLHDRMEQLCSPFVDFAAADHLTEQTLKELFS